MTPKKVRAWYLHTIAHIPHVIQCCRLWHTPLLLQAFLAFYIRHLARVIARDFTPEPLLETLRQRDTVKYGHPNGPTFPELVEQDWHKTHNVDQALDDVIASSERTDGTVNQRYELHSQDQETEPTLAAEIAKGSNPKHNRAKTTVMPTKS